MKNAWTIEGASPLFATKEDRRKFGIRKTTGGKLPAFVLPGSLKNLPPTMMERKDGNVRKVESGKS